MRLLKKKAEEIRINDGELDIQHLDVFYKFLKDRFDLENNIDGNFEKVINCMSVFIYLDKLERPNMTLKFVVPLKYEHISIGHFIADHFKIPNSRKTAKKRIVKLSHRFCTRLIKCQREEDIKLMESGIFPPPEGKKWFSKFITDLAEAIVSVLLYTYDNLEECLRQIEEGK